NDIELEVEEGKTILEVAREQEIPIPTLCYHKDLSPYGACRLCLVEIVEGGRPGLEASCVYKVTEGLKVKTDTERVKRSRKIIFELLLARCGDAERKEACER
ncbi:MAG: 2Fe-2S iron-sulfur cluster-binding protein, partial [Planctomycetota bacterium]